MKTSTALDIEKPSLNAKDVQFLAHDMTGEGVISVPYINNPDSLMIFLSSMLGSFSIMLYLAHSNNSGFALAGSFICQPRHSILSASRSHEQYHNCKYDRCFDRSFNIYYYLKLDEAVCHI